MTFSPKNQEIRSFISVSKKLVIGEPYARQNLVDFTYSVCAWCPEKKTWILLADKIPTSLEASRKASQIWQGAQKI